LSRIRAGKYLPRMAGLPLAVDIVVVRFCHLVSHPFLPVGLLYKFKILRTMDAAPLS
jgi:hypothetical protein